MSKDAYQRYNLPGFGFVRIRLFRHSKRVFEFLDGYGHIEQLHKIDQLGSIRRVLPGAHHTRYEYLMAQLAIITELCHLTGQLPAGLSLARGRTTFGQLDGIDSPPSNGEVLQVLALLGNIGHLPGTFSSERAFLKFLRDHPKSRTAFRQGLPAEDRQAFSKAVDRDKTHQFNYFIAAFLLNRYRRRQDGDSVADFCQKIIRFFISPDLVNSDQSLAALWDLYRSLRRLTYLALDSHYAPVPFSLDLGPIFFSLDHFLSDVFSQDSTFQGALQRIEGVLRDTVYMAPEQLINHAEVGNEVLLALENLDSEPTTIGHLWTLLGPNRKVNQLFQAAKSGGRGELGRRKIVQVSYDLDPALAPSVLPDPMEWERSARDSVGIRSGSFAADFDPGHRHLKVSAALANGMSRQAEWKATLGAARQVVELEARLISEGVQPSAPQATRNGIDLLKFILPQALGPGRRCRLRTKPVVGVTPVIRCSGSTRAADLVKEYKGWAASSGFFDSDALNEIQILETTLRTISYRGALIAFAGSTEVIENEVLVAEFDGIVVLLSRPVDQASLVIVEAKNTSNGNTEADRQLRRRMSDLGVTEERFALHHIGSKGAYAELVVSEG